MRTDARARIVVAALVALSVASSSSARAEAPPAPPSAPSASASEDDGIGHRLHEIGFGTVAAIFQSDRRVLGGVGAGPAYRLDLTRHFAAYAEAAWLLYVGNAFTAAVGASWRVRFTEMWEPLAGIQVRTFTGSGIEVVTSNAPAPPPRWVFAPQARLDLLRFAWKEATASMLGVDFGYGPDSGTLGLAFAMSVLDVSVRF